MRVGINKKKGKYSRRLLIAEELTTQIPQPHILFLEYLYTNPPDNKLATFLLQSAWSVWNIFGDNIENFHEFIWTKNKIISLSKGEI